MSKKTLIVAVLAVTIFLIGIVILSGDSDKNDIPGGGNLADSSILNEGSDLVDLEKVNLLRTPQESEQILETAGISNPELIPNQYGGLDYNYVFGQKGETLLQVGLDKIIPISPVRGAIPISQDEVVVTRAADFEDELEDGVNYLESPIEAYIYNTRTQNKKLFFETDERVIEVFPNYKDGWILLNLGNKIDVYNKQGEFIKNLYQTKDKEQLIVAEQSNVPKGKYKIYILGKGSQILDLE